MVQVELPFMMRMGIWRIYSCKQTGLHAEKGEIPISTCSLLPILKQFMAPSEKETGEAYCFTNVGQHVRLQQFVQSVNEGLPQWRRGSGLDFGLEDLGSIPCLPSLRVTLWWQGGKRHLWTSRCQRRGRLGMLKTPSCPWRGCPAAGQNLGTGHLSRHYIAER